MPFYLLQNEPIAPGLRRIAREQITIGLRDSGDDMISLHRGVHSLRIRCKKLRGLLRLQQPLMGSVFLVEDQRIRNAARHLAENRDREVVAKALASFNDSTRQPGEGQPSVSAQDLEQSRRILMQCLAATDDWPPDLHGFYDLAPGFAGTYRKCLGAWEHVLEEQSDENFHRLRRWGKYHWYHIRILERLNKPKLRKRRKKLRRLQLALGDAHDLALLQAHLGTEQIDDRHLLEQVRLRKETLYAGALRSGRQIFDVPVSDLVADLSRYWADQDNSSRHVSSTENQIPVKET